jgi:hypothetical protein
MHDQEFREQYTPDFSILIKSCEVEVSLLPDYKRAKYQYNYTIRVVQGKPQADWFHLVPSKLDQVSLSATDEHGSLQTEHESQNEHKTKVTIKFREVLQVGQEYSFRFSYETEIISIPFSQVFSRSVVYTDAFYHDNPCDLLLVTIHLPEKCFLTEAKPPADKASGTLSYKDTGMRPLDDFAFLVAYKKHRLGKQFWLWVGTTIVSVLLGALVRKFIF